MIEKLPGFSDNLWVKLSENCRNYKKDFSLSIDYSPKFWTISKKVVVNLVLVSLTCHWIKTNRLTLQMRIQQKKSGTDTDTFNDEIVATIDEIIENEGNSET